MSEIKTYFDPGKDDTTVITLPNAHIGMSFEVKTSKDSKLIIQQNPTITLNIKETKCLK